MSAVDVAPSAVDAGLPAGGWSPAREMTAFEALMWRLESDPRLRSPMTAVDVLDRVPDWDRLVAAHDWATRLVPRFRMRVVEPPFQLGAPQWAVAPDFDLGLHLGRTRLPEPGTLRQALDVAQELAVAPFDRTRPPWRALLIDGLEDGRAVYVLKLHHSITDGLGGIQLLTLLHSRRRDPTPEKAIPAPPEEERLSPLRALAEQAARAVPAALGAAAARTARTAARVAVAPTASAGEALTVGGSVARMLTPPPAEPSPLLRGRSGVWHFGVLETTVAALKAAGKAAGCSLNDAFVAALLGGFRRYHEQLGHPIDELPMAMPISLRRDDHAMGGNRFGAARLAAPAGVADAADRMRLVRESVLTAREEPALDLFGVIAPVLNRVPMPLVTRWYAGQSARLDLQASNVPGIPVPVYMAGAEIERMFPFGPLPGCAVMASLVSHVGVCCIGVNCDTGAVTDTEAFMACLQDGLDEVLAVGITR